MLAGRSLSRTAPLQQLPPEVIESDEELASLAALALAGLPLAPVIVVPATVEERFYHSNNLPEQLLELFAAVDLHDPDEDDLEELAPVAEALVRQHYLLDEFIDDFYQATAALPAMLCVRRPWDGGQVAARGRPALLALKRAYQRDWSLDEVSARLRRRHAIALEARPLLLHDAREAAVDPELTRRAAEALARPVTLRLSEGGGIVGLRPGSTTPGRVP